MAALAHYNLGLVALGAGNPDEAARWFALAEREATDERLRSLATTQLASAAAAAANATGSATARSPPATTTTSRWSPAATCSVSAARTTRFAELQLAAAAPLVGPWRFDGGVVLLDYQDLDSFDQLSANVGARYRLPLGDWAGEAACN